MEIFLFCFFSVAGILTALKLLRDIKNPATWALIFIILVTSIARDLIWAVDNLIKFGIILLNHYK